MFRNPDANKLEGYSSTGPQGQTTDRREKVIDNTKLGIDIMRCGHLASDWTHVISCNWVVAEISECDGNGCFCLSCLAEQRNEHDK